MVVVKRSFFGVEDPFFGSVGVVRVAIRLLGARGENCFIYGVLCPGRMEGKLRVSLALPQIYS